jgi:hypothetical protein
MLVIEIHPVLSVSVSVLFSALLHVWTNNEDRYKGKDKSCESVDIESWFHSYFSFADLAL